MYYALSNQNQSVEIVFDWKSIITVSKEIFVDLSDVEKYILWNEVMCLNKK